MGLSRKQIKENDIVCRILKMVIENDMMFTCIADDIIETLILQDYIDIDLDNETIEGTQLNKKGYEFLNNHNVTK